MEFDSKTLETISELRRVASLNSSDRVKLDQVEKKAQNQQSQAFNHNPVSELSALAEVFSLSQQQIDSFKHPLHQSNFDRSNFSETTSKQTIGESNRKGAVKTKVEVSKENSIP